MEKEVKTSNIPHYTVGKVVDELSYAYSRLIKEGMPLSTMPSVMLWGPPGVGKSQAVRQIALDIEEETDKKVAITDVRLLLFNPVDLRGIPTSNEDKTLAVWLKPKIFQMDESEDVVNILFLDEISAAPQSVQAAAYQITLDRVIGEHRLPDNCIVIAAGNRVTDRSVAFKMPKALANRLLHIEIELDYMTWKRWAIDKEINEKVISFLDTHKYRLMMFDSSRDDLAFATPRAWEMVSNILNRIDDDVEKMLPLISGLIGVELAVEFSDWDRNGQWLPDVEDIFEGTAGLVPADENQLYTLVKAMVMYARNLDSYDYRIGNSLEYAKRMPPEYAMMLVSEYSKINDIFRQELNKNPSFVKLINTYGRMLGEK